MIDKKAKIIELLLEYPNGLKAREISKKLPYIDKKEVNQILYGNPNDFVATDYVWKLTNIKAKSSSHEREYKKAEIDDLFHNYNTPYFDTKKLADLDLPTFKMAVEHAKEVAEHNLSYDLGKMWYKTVIMPDRLFREVIDKRIEQKRIETEMRVAKIKRERQEKAQREEAIKRICRINNLSENVANSLISSEISAQEVENRIRNVRYYEAKYPEFNIALSNGIMMTTQDFNKYISGKLEKPRTVCLGNCSTCRREVCLMDK